MSRFRTQQPWMSLCCCCCCRYRRLWWWREFLHHYLLPCCCSSAFWHADSYFSSLYKPHKTQESDCFLSTKRVHVLLVFSHQFCFWIIDFLWDLIYERGKCVLDFVCVKSDGSVSFFGALHRQTISRHKRLQYSNWGRSGKHCPKGLDYVTRIRFIYSCVFGLRNIFFKSNLKIYGGKF